MSDISEIDVRLKLLRGKPLYAEGFGFIDPIKLGKIDDIGYSTYVQYLNILVLTIEDLGIHDEMVYELDSDEEKFQIHIFDIFVNSKFEELTILFLNMLKFFLDVEVIEINLEYQCLIINDDTNDVDDNKLKIINRSNYDNIKEIIILHNIYNDETKSKYNPANKKAQDIIDKLNKAHNDINKHKKNNNENIEITFADIVSSVSTKSYHYNKHNIWDLTIYQLYDEYKRLNAIADFETNIMAIVHGAKIDLKHWSCKI